MKMKVAIISLIITGAMFILGLIVIFSASSAGRNAGDAAIRNQGGSMDTNQYERVIDGTTASYQTGGLVISLVGGLGLLLSGYALYKEV